MLVVMLVMLTSAEHVPGSSALFPAMQGVLFWERIVRHAVFPSFSQDSIEQVLGSEFSDLSKGKGVVDIQRKGCWKPNELFFQQAFRDGSKIC